MSKWCSDDTNLLRTVYYDGFVRSGLSVDVLNPDTLSHLPLNRVIDEVNNRWPSAKYTTKRFRGELLSMASRVGRVDVLEHYYNVGFEGMPAVLTKRFIRIATEYGQNVVLQWFNLNRN